MKNKNISLQVILLMLLFPLGLQSQSPPYEVVPGFNYLALYNSAVPNAFGFSEFGIYDIENIDDDIYFGMAGGGPYGGGFCSPWYCISRGVLGKIDNTGTVQVEGVLEEEGFLDMERLGNELVICGPDATDYVADFRMGFNYTYSNVNGLKKFDRRHNFKQVRATFTNLNGNYVFNDLEPGFYFVRFVRPKHFALSPLISDGPCQSVFWTGSSNALRRDWAEQSDTLNNDASFRNDSLFRNYFGSFPGAFVEVSGPSAGVTTDYTNLKIDCGLQLALGQPADAPKFIFGAPSLSPPPNTTIGGRVWFDANRDGYIDPTENGRPGVRVELYTYDFYFPDKVHSTGVFADKANNEAYVLMGAGSNITDIYKYSQGSGDWSRVGTITNATQSSRLAKINNIWFSREGSGGGASDACSPLTTPNGPAGVYYSTDLNNWTHIPSSSGSATLADFPRYRHQVVTRKGNASIQGIDQGLNLSNHPIPSVLGGSNSTTTVSNEHFYIGTNSGRIYRSADLSTWEYLASVGKNISTLHYWEEENALLIGTREANDGRIYRIDNIGNHTFQCGPYSEALTLYYESNGSFTITLHWDEVSVGTYTVHIYNHCTGSWTSVNTTTNSYTTSIGGLSGCTQFDYYIEATCPATGTSFQSNTVSAGNSCCQFTCQPIDFTARWNPVNNTYIDFDWTEITGVTNYELYWSPNNFSWNLFQTLPAGTNYFLDTSGWRSFMIANGYSRIYFKVRAVCTSGGFYESGSKRLGRYWNPLRAPAKQEIDIEPISSIKEFTLSPNPTSGKVHMNSIEDLENARISVTDINGKKVFEVNILSRDSELDLTHLNPGVYIIEFRNNDRLFAEKLIIE